MLKCAQHCCLFVLFNDNKSALYLPIGLCLFVSVGDLTIITYESSHILEGLIDNWEGVLLFSTELDRDHVLTGPGSV
jgi:hypothetical protein